VLSLRRIRKLSAPRWSASRKAASCLPPSSTKALRRGSRRAASRGLLGEDTDYGGAVVEPLELTFCARDLPMRIAAGQRHRSEPPL